MADETIYVSKLGNDGTGAINDPLLPFLTHQAAFDAATIGNDITIITSDGSYDTSDGGNNYLSMTRAVNSVSITAENDYGATLTTSVAAQGRVIHASSGVVASVTLGKIIIDAEEDTAGCITNSSPSLVIDGTQMKGSTDLYINSTATSNLSMINSWLVEMPAIAGRILNLTNTGVAAGTYLIEDGTITLNGSAITNRLINIDLAVDGQTVTFQDNVISGTIGSVTSADALVWCRGVETVSYLRNSASLTGADGKLEGFVVAADATFLCDKVRIEDNHLNFGTNQADLAVYGIKVGEEDTTNQNRINEVKVDGNTVIGADHSFMFGHITGAKGNGNYAASGVIGYLCKGTTTCEWAGGISVDMSGYHSYAKADTDSDIANNTFIASTVAPASGFIYAGLNIAVISTGTKFTNNISYSDVTVAKYADCEATCTANYENNLFYSSVAEPANPYAYVGTDYSTMALWQTAVDATAETAANNITSDPLFTDSAGNDFSLTASSPSVGAGKKWWTGGNPVSYGGEPIADFGTDIGGIMSTHNPFHPVNL